MEYPELKRAVCDQAKLWGARVVLIEDKASGTQLIQELKSEGMYAVKPYKASIEKIMRMSSATSVVENGFVHLPAVAEWREVYLHELVTFPAGKHDDQVDSTSQALDWFKTSSIEPGIITYYREECIRIYTEEGRLDELKELLEEEDEYLS